MPLDATKPAAKLDALADQLSAITLGLNPKGNTDAIGLRLARGWKLRSLIEKECEAAGKEAVAAGVLPDHAKAPLSVGTHPRVYAGELVEISATVVEQAERLDGAALVADLLAAGVKAPLLKKLVAKHTKRFNPSHRYSATLVGG